MQINWPLYNLVRQFLAKRLVECAQNVVVSDQQMRVGAQFRQHASQLHRNVTSTNHNRFSRRKIRIKIWDQQQKMFITTSSLFSKKCNFCNSLFKK